MAVGQLDGRTVVVSGSVDRTVRVWDAATGAPLADPFTGHTGAVNAVAVGQLDGRTVVVSGSDDRTVRVWDAATGAPLADPFTGHTGEVTAVAVGQLDGRTVVVSGSGDQTVRVWDAATGAPLADPFTGHTGGVNAVAVGQLDGRTVVVSGSSDRTVRVWATGTLARDIPWRCGKAEILPSKVDLAASALGIVFVAPSRFVIATELGIVSLRMPVSIITIDRVPLSDGQKTLWRRCAARPDGTLITDPGCGNTPAPGARVQDHAHVLAGLAAGMADLRGTLAATVAAWQDTPTPPPAVTVSDRPSVHGLARVCARRAAYTAWTWTWTITIPHHRRG